MNSDFTGYPEGAPKSTRSEREFWGMYVGDLIGSGVGRKVYAMRNDPTVVLKVEMGGRSFQNVIEWETWKEAEALKAGDGRAYRWLAPCRDISSDGTLLIMERTRQPTEAQFPKLMPAWMTDFKRANFGLIGSRIVAHDYGLFQLAHTGFTKRMKRANWW